LPTGPQLEVTPIRRLVSVLLDEGTQKAVISLVSVIVGWILAQTTNLLQSWWRSIHLKKALITELEDLRHHLNRVCLSYERTLQLCAIKGVDHSVPLKLNHHVFEKYYVDVCLKLSRSQRASYEIIHGHIDSLNRGMVKLSDFHPVSKYGLDGKKMEDWTQLVRGQYHNARIAHWHISFHLKNKKNPDLGDIGSDVHKYFLSEIDSIEEHIVKIMEEAKHLKREDFEKAVNKCND
jgi:hypothetical protein